MANFVFKKSKVYIPIYGGYLIVCQTDNINKASNRFNNIYDESKDDDCQACVLPNIINKHGVVEYVVLFRENTNVVAICHEALHIVNSIFERTGVKRHFKNQEPECYLLGWVVDTIIKNLKNVSI